ncbi:MAG TPA: alkaline phytoceramidase [Thiothrix sp.]|nr:alkaline phytoceramidase [Thiothrix sp.]
MFGIANFWNVVSNLPFLFVGLWGLQWIVSANDSCCLTELRFIYILFFIGIALVALGSSYYHFSPSNSTLVWDRLPITIAFMALFAIILGEFVSVRFGQLILLPLLAYGIFAVMYWHYSETMGQGDLRWYIVVQLIPILSLPIILLLFNATFTLKNAYWLLLASYLLAKLLEYFDAETYNIVPLLSGHSLKHLVAAFGIYLLIRAYKKRCRCNRMQ